MNALLKFIRAHGHLCEVGSAGRIRALETFTQHGRAGCRIVLIPATPGAVRAWLGY